MGRERQSSRASDGATSGLSMKTAVTCTTPTRTARKQPSMAGPSLRVSSTVAGAPGSASAAGGATRSTTTASTASTSTSAVRRAATARQRARNKSSPTSSQSSSQSQSQARAGQRRRQGQQQQQRRQPTPPRKSVTARVPAPPPAAAADFSLSRSIDRSALEQLNDEVEGEAAQTIQRWYRRVRSGRAPLSSRSQSTSEVSEKRQQHVLELQEELERLKGDFGGSPSAVSHMTMSELEPEVSAILHSPQSPSFSRGGFDSPETNRRPVTQRAAPVATLAAAPPVSSARRSEPRSSAKGSLLRFLDDVETSASALDVTSTSSIHAPSTVRGSPGQSYVSTASSVVTTTNARLKEMQMQIESQNKYIGTLTDALKAARGKQGSELKQAQAEHQQAIDKMQKEYEEVIARHLGFVDQLLADKQQLTDKCDELGQEIKAVERRFQAKQQDADDAHRREIKKKKEAWEAAEKGRREAWVNSKTKEIKDFTIKGLEPEIQRMIAKHKNETRRMQEQHQAELDKQREALTDAAERRAGAERERHMRELEDAVEREKETTRVRIRDLTERDESQLSDLRRRLAADFQLERDHMDTERRRERQHFEDVLAKMRKDHDEQMQSARVEARQQLEACREQYEDRLRRVSEEGKVEKEAWQVQMNKKMASELRAREDDIWRDMEKKRDDEIEAVIARLEQDTTDSVAAAERRFQDHLDDAKRGFAQRLHEAQDAERAWKTKYMDLVQDSTTTTDKIGELNRELMAAHDHAAEKAAKVGALERQIQNMHHQLDSAAESERHKVIVDLRERDARIKELETRLDAQQQQWRHQVDEMKREQDDELGRVHDRVRQAVAKKDETIQALRDQLQEAELRFKHTEQILQRQQSELLGH